jgi:hypothetical protein
VLAVAVASIAAAVLPASSALPLSPIFNVICVLELELVIMHATLATANLTRAAPHIDNVVILDALSMTYSPPPWLISTPMCKVHNRRLKVMRT